MADKKYTIKGKKVYADISKLSEKDIVDVQNLTKLGYEFVQKDEVSKRAANNSLKGKNIAWFKENLSPDDWKKFEEEKKEKGYMAIAREWVKKVEAKQ